jgi:arylsulfatase A-like enzyme
VRPELLSRSVLLAMRLVAAALLVAVATYCLLASIPFSFYHFLQFAHFWWLPLIVRFHPVGMALGSALLLVSFPEIAWAWRARLALAGGLMCVWMMVTAAVPALQTYENAALLFAAPMLMLATTGALNLLTRREAITRVGPPSVTPPLLFEYGMLAALLSSCAYIAHSAAGRQTSVLHWREVIVAGGAALAGHVGVFAVAIGSAAALRAIGRRNQWPAWYAWLGTSACLAALMAALVRRTLVIALMLGDGRATVIAVVLAATIVTFWLGLIVDSIAAAPAAEQELKLLPIRPRHHAQWLPLLVSAGVLVIVIWMAPVWLLLADWGMTVQKLLVLASWTGAFVFVRALPNRRSARAALAGGVAVVLATALTTSAVSARGSASVGSSDTATPLAVERYAMIDPSLALVLDVVRPIVTDHEFYSLLWYAGEVTNKNIPAVPLRIVPALAAPAAKPPNVVVVVVDSLRPDYLGAYNPSAVDFTPAITAFARENIVMRRAFAAYGGTALSEPSIWAGGLVPRFNYVQPFAEMNNLERLARAANYRRYISLDKIIRTTSGDTSGVSNLDPHLDDPGSKEQQFKFDLCSTTEEFRRRLQSDRADARPIFMYTQPQNLHLRVLANEFPNFKGVEVSGEEFFQPAVSALRRVDACFGQLLEALKREKLYDQSIIVFTSDHGDAYGEDGRFGHAFYLAPETIRIPLILHVPPSLRQGRVWDETAIAFATDITPTLFELLGAGYAPTTPIIGRPLLAASKQQLESRMRDVYLVQSSYSRAYGLIDREASWLYAANANQAREDLYDMRTGRTMNISATDRLRYRRWLFDRLNEVNVFYAPR